MSSFGLSYAPSETLGFIPERLERLTTIMARQVLEKKWKKMEVSAETADKLSGSGDDGYFVVKLAGPVVTSLEGLASLDQAKPVR